MAPFVIIAIGLIAATIHLFVSRTPRTADRVLALYLLYTLLLGVGIGGLFSAVGHLAFADRVAEQLGWPSGTGFQTEVGLFDLAFGVLGVCCIWFRDQWWNATAIGWAIFGVGAAANHLLDVTEKGDSASGNVGSLVLDLVVPALLIGLLVALRVAQRGRAPSVTAGAASSAAGGD